MRSLLLVALAAMISFGCSSKRVKKTRTANQEKTTQVKLYTFDGRQIQVNELSMFSGGERYKGQQKKLADPFFVIQHPEGNLLWDTGLPERVVEEGSEEIYGGDIIFFRQDSVAHQLQKINLTPEDIDYIAFSHHHLDHTGGITAFKNATLLVQSVEYKAMREDTSASALNPFAGFTKVNKLQGDHQVFGDGKVVIKSYPGHTIGHQALYLELENKGPVLLTGDLYHFTENREEKVVPSFNYDTAQTKESMQRFEEFAKKKNARVIIQHEMEHFNQLPEPPKYWD